MYLSKRAINIKESITLKLNEKAVGLAEKGNTIYNLTAGQLPFRPMDDFVKSIEKELNFLKSYQYAPVAGFADLRKKLKAYVENNRSISFNGHGVDFDCVISNGAKHSIYNIIGSITDPGDEIIVLAPYWISYPEMVMCWGGIPVVVESNKHNNFTPTMDDIRKKITSKTKAILVNSPNNPAGIHYSNQWMNDFAKLLNDFPNLLVISDEIYYELSYFDPKPTYFYQYDSKLLKRTMIVEGISKSFAATGLRIGFCITTKEIADAISKLQAQTTSSANSLIQRALVSFDFAKMPEFLNPVRNHLKINAQSIRRIFSEMGLSHIWYQTTSAFYYLVDFSSAPVFKRYSSSSSSASASASTSNGDECNDYCIQICSDLLEKHGIAMVPGADFGIHNSGRLSLVLEEEIFTRAMKILANFLRGE
ncbi:MAG: aminotransferase class I/II-fold pyridoxal phosphate-dependent enzyme [Oligoflexia bacterium]|nr:aminotransferase class I/II-fold pyridoxal phosphate-dependent enzyme [Oligoflexia bacterium]